MPMLDQDSFSCIHAVLRYRTFGLVRSQEPIIPDHHWRTRGNVLSREDQKGFKNKQKQCFKQKLYILLKFSFSIVLICKWDCDNHVASNAKNIALFKDTALRFRSIMFKRCEFMQGFMKRYLFRFLVGWKSWTHQCKAEFYCRRRKDGRMVV